MKMLTIAGVLCGLLLVGTTSFSDPESDVHQFSYQFSSPFQGHTEIPTWDYVGKIDDAMRLNGTVGVEFPRITFVNWTGEEVTCDITYKAEALVDPTNWWGTLNPFDDIVLENYTFAEASFIDVFDFVPNPVKFSFFNSNGIYEEYFDGEDPMLYVRVGSDSNVIWDCNCIDANQDPIEADIRVFLFFARTTIVNAEIEYWYH